VHPLEPGGGDRDRGDEQVPAAILLVSSFTFNY